MCKHDLSIALPALFSEHAAIFGLYDLFDLMYPVLMMIDKKTPNARHIPEASEHLLKSTLGTPSKHVIYSLETEFVWAYLEEPSVPLHSF